MTTMLERTSDPSLTIVLIILEEHTQLSLSSLPDGHPKLPMNITAGVTRESRDSCWCCTRMEMPHPNEAVLQKETPR